MTRPSFPARKSCRFRFSLFVVVILCATGVAFAQNYRSFNRSSGLDLVELSKAKASCCGTKAAATNFTPLNSPEYETYKLTATYYSLRDNLTVTLMLNNKGPEPILATPTFYSMAGEPLHLAPITVPAASYIDVDMHQLLANAGDEFREGSMNIAYSGGNLQLGA